MEYPKDDKPSLDGVSSSPPKPSSEHAHISLPIPIKWSSNSLVPSSPTHPLLPSEEPKPLSSSRKPGLRTNYPMTRAPTYVECKDTDPAAAQARIWGAGTQLPGIPAEPADDSFDPSRLPSNETKYYSQPEAGSSSSWPGSATLRVDNNCTRVGYSADDPATAYRPTHRNPGSDHLYAGHHSKQPTSGSLGPGQSSEHSYPPRTSGETKAGVYPTYTSGSDKLYLSRSRMLGTDLKDGNTSHGYHDYGKSEDHSVEGEQSEVRPLVMIRCPEEDFADHVGFKLSNDRISALNEVDNAEFSWFHFRVCLIAGVGFFTDAYDIFSINIASVMMAFVYNSNGALAQTAIKAAAPIGTLIGQLLFGWLADRIGRKRMYGIELIIIIIGTFGQSLSANADIGTINIFAALIVWRIIMGLGIGGDYPLSAVIASEFAAIHNRGKMMTAVFANQGWGQLASTIIAIIIVSIYHNRFPSPDQPLSLDTPCTSPLLITSPTSPTCLLRNNIDQAWRILIGLGCVPAVLALYFRLTIPETPRFTMDIERNVKQAINDIEQFLTTGRYAYDPDSVVVRVVAPRGSWRDFGMYFRRWENWSVLVGCAYSWFAIDVIFYGLGLNTDKFFTALGFVTHLRGLTPCPNGDAQALNSDNTANDVFRDFKNLIIANLLLSAVGLVPGYWATFLVIEKLGRKKIQMIGFGMLTVLFAIMGGVSSTLLPNSSQPSSCTLTPPPPSSSNSLFTITPSAKIFLFLFILASFFQNFGPNTTTFLLPGENFPTRYRSTCHGICAACGKVGAIVSQFAFQDVSPKNVLLSYIAFTLTGGVTTYYLVKETSQETLEEISGEESSSFIHGLVRSNPSDPKHYVVA